MKEIHELNVPEDLHYARTHEWVRTEGESVRMGITDYAQDQLGDIVFVELPQIGARFERGQPLGVVESVKAVSELNAPVSGEVMSVNKGLDGAPERVNRDPYGDGWMVELRPSDASEMGLLLTQDSYLGMLKGTS